MRRVFYYNLTYKCNQTCRFCFSHNTNIVGAADVLSFEHFTKTLRDHDVGEADRVVLNGGEPTLHPSLVDIVSFSHKHGCETVLYTNGILLFEREYAKALVEAGVDRITVPIHGEPRLHDSITKVRGSFEKTLAGIRHLIELSAKTLEMKFIVSNAMANSDFSISDFVCKEFGDLAEGCGVVIAGQVNTRVSLANRCKCVQDERYCNYVARQLKEASQRRSVKFCDFEICRFPANFRSWFDGLRPGEDAPSYEYRFCDSNVSSPRLMSYCSIRKSDCCAACSRNKFCRSILNSYFVTKIEGESKGLDWE